MFLQIIYFEKNIVLVRGRLRSRLKFGFLLEFPLPLHCGVPRRFMEEYLEST